MFDTYFWFLAAPGIGDNGHGNMYKIIIIYKRLNKMIMIVKIIFKMNLNKRTTITRVIHPFKKEYSIGTPID